MIRYTVKCSFSSAPETVQQWLEWLRQEHIADVQAGGASGAEIVEMTEETPAFEIRYRFPSNEIFQQYLSDHAPRLREEGLRRFPLELGLQYARTDGKVIFQTD